ncbi:alpha/beta hydrolase [Gordonia soli]|nr:alpha/beta hydrolase [Gordonia soli]
MVMADRPEVKTASTPVTTLAVAGLASTMLTGLARVPFTRPFSGPSGILDNLGQSVTRQAVRSFMGYSMSLPIDEFRSLEKILDDICKVVIPPFVERIDDVDLTHDELAGVPGIWCRAKDACQGGEKITGTILYLHGGGYIGTSPIMYAAFASTIVERTGCEIFIADYRMAPEFPFPAPVHDAADVYRELLARGVDPAHLIVAGDSGGGGLAASLMAYLRDHEIPKPAAVALFSPEIDLDLDHPSITDNAATDILPWNVPVTPYLHGVQPDDERVSIVYADLGPAWFPPTFVTCGSDEMFRDGIREFTAALEKGGVEVQAIEEPGMFHVYPILMPWSEAAHTAFDALGEYVEKHVTPSAEPATA